MSFVILVGKERYQTAKCGKTNIKISRKSYNDGKHKIVDKSISVVLEEEAAHRDYKF
jgi:CDGSH-type Zn-finger protein